MRRIKRAKINFISLCPRGKNNIATLYKSDGTFDRELLVKSFSDKGELAAVVYSPERRDKDGDIASEDVIKEMMYEAARNGFNVDMRHDGVPVAKSKAFVAESFIIQKGDPRFADTKDYAGNPVDVTGAWGVVIKIEDEELRQKYRDGKWNGVSMGGTAEMIEETPSHKEDDMTQAELEAALAKSNAALATTLATTLTKAIADAIKPSETDDAKKERIAKEAKDKAKAAFVKGATASTLKKMALNAKREAILTDLDVTDAEAVEKAQADLEPIEAEIAEIEKAEKEAKAAADKNKASQQPVAKGDNGDAPRGRFEGLEKADNDTASIGSRMAKHVNTNRGFVTAK